MINAFGNGLSVSTNMGTSPWTASEVNIGNLLGIGVGIPMFVVGVLVAFINQLLIRHWDVPRLVGEVLFVSFFSYFVDLFVALFHQLGIPNLPILVRLMLCLAGIAIFCTAISLYQRANIIMHPNDDTTNILRFLYFKENVVRAQIVNFLPPVIVIIVIAVVTRQVASVNLGTLVCIFGNGPMIGLSDRYIWPGLKHNFKVKPTA